MAQIVAKNYNEMLMDNVIMKYGYEHELTITFCKLCELDIPHIYDVYILLMEM